MLWRRSRSSLVLAQPLTCGFLEHTERSRTNAGVTNYMVGALDPETADRLAELGAPHFVLFDVAVNGTALGLGPKDLAWGSPAFHSMGRVKINLLKTFLGYGLDVLLCDTDTVWMADPTPYFLRYPTADILISTDHMFPTVEYGDTGLEMTNAAHSAMNIGVMFFRSTTAVHGFVEEWVLKLDADPGAWDQVRETPCSSNCQSNEYSGRQPVPGTPLHVSMTKQCARQDALSEYQPDRFVWCSMSSTTL